MVAQDLHELAQLGVGAVEKGGREAVLGTEGGVMFFGHRGFDHVRWRRRETRISCIADDDGAERGPFCVRGDEGSGYVDHDDGFACAA